MKIILALFIALPFFAFAAEKYGVYDSQGNRVSAFEADLYELPEKTRQVKANVPNKNLYVSSFEKGKNVKPSSRYRYKAEIESYIEASRKETFSVCPEKGIEGIWISEHSVALDEKNCLSVQAPDLAGTFRVLFMENSGLTDTIQVLVEQSYIQMGDYSHKIYVVDSTEIKSRIKNSRPDLIWRYDILPGNYESRSYSHPLIVDKTKFTMGDAHYYYKVGNIIEKRFYNSLVYPEKIEGSKLPQPESHLAWRFANERSKKEGLDTAYYINAFGYIALDTSASGYRLPFDDEWFFLMRAGASTRYYWGDQEDSLTVSRYAWVRPVGLKPVAQRHPNKFGLYDMVGIAGERVMIRKDGYHDFGPAGGYNFPEGDFMDKIGPVMLAMRMPSISQTCTLEEKTSARDGEQRNRDWVCTDIDQKPRQVAEKAGFGSFRFLRKTPKLHKLEKF